MLDKVGTAVAKNQNSDFERVIGPVPGGFVHPLICPIGPCYTEPKHLVLCSAASLPEGQAQTAEFRGNKLKLFKSWMELVY